ncbi:MAG: RES family NAD+ phosphorylase [Lautropia sp.]|nr:RES family NAD+ phosphorylase [Lautropia sp.]
MAEQRSCLDKPAARSTQVTDTCPQLPAPPSKLALTIKQWQPGTVLHRVHLSRYAAAQFNPGLQGNARFSPIQNEHGQPVPTLYAGATLDCVLMETVFHDVPFAPGFKSLDKQKLQGQMHAILSLHHPLQLVDLSSIALRKLGIRRKQLIDTDKEAYPYTRQWAEAIHHQCPTAQGLSWVSRQDDAAHAFVLFGDRIPDGTLIPIAEPVPLLDEAERQDAVFLLAERIGVLIVSGI